MSLSTTAESGRASLRLRGDESELYARHQDRLWRIVRSRVAGPAALIDDACQAAWLIVLRNQPDRATFFAYLVKIATHEGWQLARRDREQCPLAPPLAHSDAPHPLDRAIGRGRTEAQVLAREQLREIAEALTDRKRTVLGLQALGFTRGEIAALLGDSERTVDRQLRKAKRSLDPLRPSPWE